jgi:predicted transcriptional regulator YdeE
MEIRVLEKEAFTVLGLKYRGKNENQEIPQLWGELTARTHEITNMVPEHVVYGVCANMDKETGEFDYIAGYRVTGADKVPGGMVAYEVPAGRFAVFTTTLPEIGDTFTNAYDVWLPEAGLEPSGELDIELYDERFDPQDPDSVFDILVAIK